MSLICAQQAYYFFFHFLLAQMLSCSSAAQQTQGRQISASQMANCQPGDAMLKGTEGIHFVAEAKEYNFLTHLMYRLASQQLMKWPEKFQQPSSNACLDSVKLLHGPSSCLKFLLIYKKRNFLLMRNKH